MEYLGIGCPVFQKRAEQLLSSKRPGQLWIHAGFCAGLRPNLPVGSIIRGTQLVSNRAEFSSGLSPRLLLEPRETWLVQACRISSGGYTEFDPFACASFEDPSVIANHTTLVAVSCALDTLATKQQVGDIFPRAIAADMESHASRILAERGLHLRVVKSVSDSWTDPLPVPGALLFDLQLQKTPIPSLVAYLVRNPGSIFALLRFLVHLLYAGLQLARALEAEVDAIRGSNYI